MGVELFNKVLGIVGVGQIGSHLTKLAQGIGMRVIAYDPYLAADRAEKMGVEMAGLSELFRRADIISVHTPLTPETKNLINAQSIATMKPGVMIVNCARGGIIHEGDLHEALKSKRVAAAAFDVFEEEPPPVDHPFFGLDNVVITPHAAYHSEEAIGTVRRFAAEEVVRVLTGQAPWSPVNAGELVEAHWAVSR